uniref:Uncharacterized protein n=1 Tax=Rhizobium leguminosarum bv. trifolii TaxID=386 RepID=A0A1C9HUD5_RHILT|nr:hypothetical protein [Rhizobium leguminosarum bv. trifolii]
MSDEILWLSNRVKSLNYALDSLDLSRPGFDGFFEKRQEGYADLAAEAMDLIERMLEKFGLTLPTKPDYYRQREGIAEPDPTWVPSASPSRLASKIHLLDKRHH